MAARSDRYLVTWARPGGKKTQRDRLTTWGWDRGNLEYNAERHLRRWLGLVEVPNPPERVEWIAHLLDAHREIVKRNMFRGSIAWASRFTVEPCDCSCTRARFDPRRGDRDFPGRRIGLCPDCGAEMDIDHEAHRRRLSYAR